ncbi:MAG: cation diffusion facilitator family transporter [Sterolibacterium sp.]
MNDEHHHPAHHASPTADDGLRWALLLTLGFAAVEAGAGWWSGSLALLGDAGHMVTDSFSLALAVFAAWLARRPISLRHSYGLQRAEVLAGLGNALLMLGVIVALAVAAVQRLLAPHPVQGEAVAVVAMLGLVINIVVALKLARSQQTFNTRGALLHVIGDLLGSVAALVAGLVIALTGWTPIDPILTLAIAALILASTWRLLQETLHTLMEGVPPHLSLETIGHAIAARPGVSSVHDLHLWSVSSQQVALSAHIVVIDLAQWETVLADVTATVNALGIDHVTLQPVPLQRQVHWMRRDAAVEAAPPPANRQ